MSRRRVHNVGHAPGTLVIDPDSPPPVLHFFGYGPQGLVEGGVAEASELTGLRNRWPVLWLNLNGGFGNEQMLQTLAEVFKIHKLALEDVVNLGQRPKVEPWPEALYVVLRALRWEVPGVVIDNEQISLFLGADFVLTIQERVGDPFDPVRKRLRDGRPGLRNGGADYLAYALIDAVVDQYFPLVQAFGDVLDELEDDVDANPNREVHARIRAARRAHIHLRRAVWPVRDVVQRLQGGDMPFIGPDTHVYLRDVYDHVLRVLDMVESQRDQVSGLSEAYMSAVSFRTNEVMSMLTLVGTIFMPLSFLAGLYGMNFDTQSPYNLPELSHPYGYPILLVVMMLMAAGLLAIFRARGWLGGQG